MDDDFTDRCHWPQLVTASLLHIMSLIVFLSALDGIDFIIFFLARPLNLAPFLLI